jgi:hypothetical protein
MTATLKIPVKDLSHEMLEDIRQKYGNAMLEITRPAEAEPGGLGDDTFWSLIDLLDWTKQGNDQLIIAPLVEALAQLPISAIYRFADILSEKLFALDDIRFARQIGRNAWIDETSSFSVDDFLYARCCVVANGRKAFETVLANPAEMPKDLTFEELLRIAPTAYRKKTNKTFNYLPLFNVETFSNQEAWGVKQITSPTR